MIELDSTLEIIKRAILTIMVIGCGSAMLIAFKMWFESLAEELGDERVMKIGKILKYTLILALSLEFLDWVQHLGK